MRLIAMGTLLAVSAVCCAADGGGGGVSGEGSSETRRAQMVVTQIEARGIDNRACSTRCAAYRVNASFPHHWKTMPTATVRCRSAEDKLFRNRTSSP